MLKIYETHSISDLLKDFESKFKFVPNDNLFGPDWKNLTKDCCPICGGKLSRMMKRQGMLICRSRKHKRTFLISSAKRDQLVAKITALSLQRA